MRLVWASVWECPPNVRAWIVGGGDLLRAFTRKWTVGHGSRSPVVLLLGLTIALVLLPSAQAHGPCRASVTEVGCLEPSSGPPGTRVTIVGTTVYRVVWNANVFYSDVHYRRGAKTVQLLSLSHVRRSADFVVPRARPGVYPVAIYDGGEGGEHYTWNSFRVRGSSSSWRTVVPWFVLPALVLLAAAAWFALSGKGTRTTTRFHARRHW
jgi:hypothetical protein